MPHIAENGYRASSKCRPNVRRNPRGRIGQSRQFCFCRGALSDLDLWRAANVMIKRYGDGAATDAEHQLPFFITTCDYTLIGEELYAASAYLSRKPELVGSLRAQDVGKLLIMLLIVLGTLLVTLGVLQGFSSHWVLDVLGTY